MPLAEQSNGTHELASTARASAAAALERAIGGVAPGDDRRRMVALRRLFLRQNVVLRNTDLSVVARVDESCVAVCRDAIGAADLAATARERFLAAFDTAMVRERRHLLCVVGTDRFQQAVAVAQPQLAPQMRSHLARFASSDDTPTKARHLRLEGTLVNLVLRSAGRPTPSSLWAGVVEETAPRNREPGAGVALSVHPGRERFQIQLDISHLVDAARLAVGNEIPVAHPDCWAWMASVAAAAPEPIAKVWRAVAVESRASFDAIVSPAAVSNVDDWLALHEVARLGVNRLRALSGLDDGDKRPSLRVDWHPPFALRVDEPTIDRISQAIDEWIQCQAGWGIGATWARATAEAVTSGRPTFSPLGPSRPSADLPTVSSLVARISGVEETSHAGVLIARLETAISQSAGGWRAPSVQPGIVGADRPSPWGSALVAVGEERVEVRSVRGEPSIFVARWPELVPAAVAGAISLVAATGRPCRSVRFARYANPAAALGAMVTPTVSAQDVLLERVDEQRCGLVVPYPHGDGTAVISVFDNAAAPIPTSELEHAVYRAGSTWGWELVASGLPLFPHEAEVARHVPELSGPSGTSVHPERWLLSADELVSCATPDGAADRFLAWQRYVRLRGLPTTVWVRFAPSPNSPTRFVPIDSVLAVEALLRDVGPDGRAIDGVAVAMPGPARESLLGADNGEQYVGELAVTFVDHWFEVEAKSDADQ